MSKWQAVRRGTRFDVVVSVVLVPSDFGSVCVKCWKLLCQNGE